MWYDLVYIKLHKTYETPLQVGWTLNMLNGRKKSYFLCYEHEKHTNMWWRKKRKQNPQIKSTRRKWCYHNVSFVAHSLNGAFFVASKKWNKKIDKLFKFQKLDSCFAWFKFSECICNFYFNRNIQALQFLWAYSPVFQHTWTHDDA